MDKIRLDDLPEDWPALRLIPRRTGLPRAVWITGNQGYPHDVRAKVSGYAAAAEHGSMPFRFRSGRGDRTR